MKKIVVIIGARPQFIKHAPVEIELKDSFELIAIHTGQHYDEKMSDIFFKELDISEPAYSLNIGSKMHGLQTGEMMVAIEPILMEVNPDCLLVYGDTNSTLAGAIVGAKLNIPVVHIEAGLRSFNKQMPEEINRIMTDHCSSVLLAPTNAAINNLRNENISTNVFKVGDVMYDMLRIAKQRGFIKNGDQDYYFATIHRPYNTDNAKQLQKILYNFNSLDYKVKFSVHPRTLKKMKDYSIDFSTYANIEILQPLGYFDSLSHQLNSKCVITDSGGIQKEAYLLKKKCITLRSETEWVETLINNWNILIFDDLDTLKEKIAIVPGEYIPNLYGDGFGAKEIKKILNDYLK